MSTETNGAKAAAEAAAPATTKLHGRAFYESIGSPKFIVAPMVDQSEFVRLHTFFSALKSFL
jgi:tRNA-dihydrouridine synthase 1